ncbi:BAH and coiled-coil domain-containing protein 1 isoform X2 [Denticeps clupeoides]|uniref:BAH and coiled-coil domain-containing protein 1 isoform X2 n=1 Tax=Denticeps clupeoides TaxID=299321 RepID=UPI0010A3D1A3|nr:BAH and coiled-coil domain-containing protein 1-like isoform X2 [Denticeps clupeoides]
MEGRDFAAPAHLLSERGALAHRAAAAAARISSAGHGSVQHAGHFPAGKYYPSHIQMAAHSGSGLVGNSSSSFMGSFLAGGLGSPAPHPPHPPRAPSSPSSPSFRGAPHSSASQIWFPHSHEAATGYPRFSGSLTHTFLPMGPLDHHANSGVLYGQHRFYDTQKENFYLRGLTSQPIIPTKHSMPPISRAGPEGGANLKGLREGGPERMVPPSRQKEPISNKQEAKDRKQHPTHQLQQTQAPPPASNQHQHQHSQHQTHIQHHHHQHHQQHSHHQQVPHLPISREEHSGHSVAAPPPQAITTPLSACLLNSKSPSNHCGSQGGAKSFSCGEGGGVRCRERVRGEMRISEQPGECVPRDQAIQHTLTYPLPHSLPATGTAHTRSFHCLQFHPHNHYNHGHPDLLYHHSTGHLPNPPTPEHGPGATTRDPKATAPPFGQTVVHHGNKSNVSFPLGSPGCHMSGNVAVGAKDKGLEKSGASEGHPHAWPRKQMPCRKAEKGPDWSLSQQPAHLPQQQHRPLQASPARSRSADPDPSRAHQASQQAKACHSQQFYVGPQPYRDCSLSGPLPNLSPLPGKPLAQDVRVGGVSCSLQRDGQKVARIRHQQHGRPGTETPGAEATQASGGHDPKRKLELTHNPNHNHNHSHNQNAGSTHNHSHNLNHNPNQNPKSNHNSTPNSPYGYSRHGHQLPVVLPWPTPPQHSETGRQHQGYMESFAAAAAGASHQAQPPMAPPAPPPPPAAGAPTSASVLSHRPPAQSSPADNSAIQGHLKYNSQQQQQQQPLHLQKSPFGGLGSLKASCSLQGSKPALAPRRGSTNDSQRPDCGGRTRDAGEVVHNDGEVRQPPVGIAVAVARQRDPPCCLTDSQGRGRSQSTIKDPSVEDDRRRAKEHVGHRDSFIRDNKERLEFARIHPSNSCHGDFSSHLMGSAGPAALQEPSAHAHSAHHHWMAQTGNPSLWMSGHSYSLGHSALHQTLPPGFPTAVPPPLQPVLPLPQDPPALVMLPSEPPAHPPSHLDVMDSSALWPPVFRHQGPAHIQHPAVFSRQQLLRQQELYALQQQQQHQQHQNQQQHRNAHTQQVQRKPEEGTVELEDILSDTQSPPASAPYYSQPNAASAHITPCCQSPCLRPHPQSTPSTPCPAPSPTPSQPTKTAEPQGQPPQDYPQSLEPDLPPGYTFPPITASYRGGPSPQAIQLAEPADLNAVQIEPTEHAPPNLSHLEEEFDCQAVVGPHPHQHEDEKLAAASTGGAPLEGVVVGCCAPIEHHPSPHPISTEVTEEMTHNHPAIIHASPVTFDSTVNSDPAVPCEPAEISVICDTLVDSEPSVACSALTPDLTHIPEPSVTSDLMATPEAHVTCIPPVTPEMTFGPPSVGCEEQNGREEPEDRANVERVSHDAPCLDSPISKETSASLSCWSLELLIAAAFCGDAPPPSPAPPTPDRRPHRGMELLSELAELRSQQRVSDSGEGDEQLTFDLRSLATLAVARTLELGSAEKMGDAGNPSSARRTLNLRRKFSWTPHHEPVCQAKAGMEAVDGQELAIRLRLAELQQRYREKQRELAKLQRKDENQKEEAPRSPVRRGPGRPRKRRTPTSPAAPADAPRKAKLLAAGLSVGRSSQRKRRKLSGQSFGPLGAAEVHFKKRSRGSTEASAADKLSNTANESEDQSDTDSWPSRTERKSPHRRKSTASLSSSSQLSRASHQSGSRLGAMSPSESQSSAQEEEDDSYDSEDEKDLKAPPSRDFPSASAVAEPTPSSVVKLEAYQKAQNKRERQHYGLCGSEGEVKVRRRAPYRPREVAAPQRRRGRRRREPPDLLTFPSSRERLERATRRSTALKRRSNWAQLTSVSLRSQRRRGRPCRAVSRLLKFGLASDEDLGEESSFSEEEDQVLPNCVLTKDHLADGLKILISKEDELLYAARVHKLQVPDLYSVLIEGERGAQPRIYVQEQLLHGAVLDVCPEKEGSLKEGTRVCAYWSERSHCLYPGYVGKGVAGTFGKVGGVMVEFDDGDRGRISLHNIRLLPPGYQIKYIPPECPLLDDKEVLGLSPCSAPVIQKKARPGRPKGSGVKNVFRSAAGTPSWSPVAPKRRAPENLFQLSQQKNPKLPHLSISAPMATKSIFSSHFEVDSFSSIAKSYGYSSFCGQGVALGGCSDPFGARKRSQEVAGTHRSRKSEFLVKLDHEGVMAPKTKNAKALQEQRGVVGVTRSEAYSHPVLLVKDNRKDGHTGPELLLEVAPPRRKPTPPVGPSDCGSVWGSFGSNPNMDEKRSEEARTAGCFMSRPSGSSCSSSSCSSSSSGSLSSSSPCSSDNDSSWSSEEEESSPTLLLQSCPPSQRPPLLAAPGHLQHAFVAKAVAVSNKLQKRKERPTSSSSPPRHRNKKHKVLENECHSHFLQAKKLWRWAGIPTQRRGMKGRARKLFYKAVVCGRETVLVGDCAVFLSTRRTRLPCIGHILGFWESWSGNMMVKVKWFYHPDEIGPGSRKWEDKHGLYQSCHEDETDVQTISHKCRVFSREEYESARHSRKSSGGLQDVYYLAGTYDPSRGQLVEAESLSGLC